MGCQYKRIRKSYSPLSAFQSPVPLGYSVMSLQVSFVPWFQNLWEEQFSTPSTKFLILINVPHGDLFCLGIPCKRCKSPGSILPQLSTEQGSNSSEIHYIISQFQDVDSLTYFSGSDVSSSNVSGSNVSRFDVSGSDVSGFDVSGSDVSNFDVSGSDVSGSDVSGSKVYATKSSDTLLDSYSQRKKVHFLQFLFRPQPGKTRGD